MKKSLTFILIYFAAGLTTVLPQTEQQSISQLPVVEPFKIGHGKSFSASPLHSRSNFQPNTALISSDAVYRDYSEALEIIRRQHVSGKKIDPDHLTKFSITAMLRTLDPHSNFFDAREYQNLLTDQQSQYFGIGATIVNYEMGGAVDTYVISTFPDSAAHRAKLRFGDKIVAVNGERVTGENSDVVRDKVRGRLGSTVRLTIERADGRHQLETIELKRSRFPQPSLPDTYLLRPGIGYIDLSNGFSYTTADELGAALKKLHDQGMESLILDLRDNPGGILEQAVKVAEKFLPAGKTIVTQRGRFALDNRVWMSDNKKPETASLVILVNGNSASASEIVAGAFQDYDRALIVGERTFGKGLVQSIFNLPERSGLTLTTAKYYTPSGRSIQRDYEHADLYDYFNHKTKLTDEEKIKSAVSTSTGRKVYGGDGVLPDEIVKSADLNQTQISLLDPLFFFSRQITAGRLPGFESYRAAASQRFGQRVRPSDFPVTDELFKAFTAFLAREKVWKFSAQKIETERAFIKTRLRYNLITAIFGNIAANQVLIEEDRQVAKAVEALPRAGELALSARKRPLKK